MNKRMIAKELVIAARELSSGMGLGTKKTDAYERTLTVSQGKPFIEVSAHYFSFGNELDKGEVRKDFKQLSKEMNGFVKKWGGATYEMASTALSDNWFDAAIGRIKIGMKMTPDEMLKFMKRELED